MLNFRVMRFLAVLCLALPVSGCLQEEEKSHASYPEMPSLKVDTLAIETATVADKVEVMATIQAEKSAVVSTRISGNITEIYVTPGSYVSKGQELLQISAKEISAKLLQASAHLNQAERNLERERKLLANKATTPETVKNSSDALKIAQANYQEAQTMLSYTSVTAPFDGLIAEKFVDVGDLAVPGKPLFYVEKENGIQVLADVPETLVANITLGMQMDISVPATGLAFKGVVAEIAPVADRRSRTVGIKLDIEKNPSLKSGQFARVTLPGSKVETILVPEEAVQVSGQLEKIFIVKDNRARLRLVRTGKVYPQGVEVLSGLSSGDRLILPSHHLLRDGQPVITQ